jgi:hypothetical protein
MSTPKKSHSWSIDERRLAFCFARLCYKTTSLEIKQFSHILNISVETAVTMISNFKNLLKGASVSGKVNNFIFEEYKNYSEEVCQSFIKDFLEESDYSFIDTESPVSHLCLIEYIKVYQVCDEVSSLQLHGCLQNWDEEVAVNEFIKKVSSKYDLEIDQEEEYDFSVSQFFQYQEHITTDDKLEHLASGKKITLLLEILRRISENNNILQGDYLTKKEYKIAYDRYDSILKRSFDRMVSELFLKLCYLKNTVDFDFTLLHKISVTEVSTEMRNPMKELYQDMKSVRIFNKKITSWSEEYKEELKDAYKLFPSAFNYILDQFYFVKNFFGKNIQHRSCVYCGISELETDDLRAKGQILTKRYGRGITMEVDQIDPYMSYAKENIALSCYWCNNAKTDEYSFEEWMKVGKIFREIWEARKISVKGDV